MWLSSKLENTLFGCMEILSKNENEINPNLFILVHYQHTLPLLLCSWLGLLSSSRQVTGLGLRE